MKSETVKIRIDSTEKDAFHRAAEVAGLSLSAWMRERLRLAAAGELERIGETPDFLKKTGT